MDGRIVVILVLAVVVCSSGCFGGGEDDGQCPLPTINPLDCVEGVVTVETEDGCSTIMCSEDLDGTEKITGELSGAGADEEVIQATVDESERIARDHVLNSSEYTRQSGYDPRLDKVVTDSCLYCWTFTYKFDAYSEADNETVDEYTMMVSVRNAAVKDTDVTAVNKECYADDECMPPDAQKDFRFSCEGEVCRKREFGDPETDYCRETGGRIEARDNKDGTQTRYCLFSDGSECRELAYYEGWCSQGEGLRECDLSLQIGSCTKERNPVCAKIEASNRWSTEGGENETEIDYVELENQPATRIEWKTYNNSCEACTSSTMIDVVLGYLTVECPQHLLTQE